MIAAPAAGTAADLVAAECDGSEADDIAIDAAASDESLVDSVATGG